MSDLLIVVGARPNFVKVAPVLHALRETGDHRLRVLHTGQHYDWSLSGAFMEQLGFPEPDHHLGVGSGSHAGQTAAVLIGVERILSEESADAVLVPGDVNSTLAAALAAAKAGSGVIHLEAGLRSRDWAMPEEVNRVVTDRVSDLLLCHSAEAVTNLRGEGVEEDRIAFVGNTMIDSLFSLLPDALAAPTLRDLSLVEGGYLLVTLHRPSLVDHPHRLGAVLEVLQEFAGRLPVVLPLHPRTRARLAAHHAPMLERMLVMNPLGYTEFVALQAGARLVVTDSGGVQEETSALGVDCITYRTTTERPVTITHGTNVLVGTDPDALRRTCEERLARPRRRREDAPVLPLWDGRAGPRAADAINAFLARRPTREGGPLAA